jgi:molybdate transport system permease protein
MEDAAGSDAVKPDPLPRTARRVDGWFFAALTFLGGIYVALIVLMLAADLAYTRWQHFAETLSSADIQYSLWLTFVTCTISGILSVWIGTPLAYLLSRTRFRGKGLLDALLDVPIVLPPLVIGLSLLILFHVRLWPGAMNLEEWLESWCGIRIAFAIPAVVLAQFAVACAFAVRTMRVTFDQINPRAEAVAMTLGSSRGRAFFEIVLPQAWRGLVTSFTLAWARSLGEFGPIMVFAGSTRRKTEVLSTSVFLELSVGRLEPAVALSLCMVAAALVVLLIVRAVGGRGEM